MSESGTARLDGQALMAQSPALAALEWPKLLDQLGRRCQSEVGRDWLFHRTFTNDPEEIERRFNQIAEAVALLSTSGGPDLALPEIQTVLYRLEKEGILSALEFLKLGGLLDRAQAVRRFFDEQQALYPVLHQLTAEVDGLPGLASEIRRIFDAQGAIRDWASPVLGELRQRTIHLALEIKERLQDLLHRPEITKALQEVYFTLRHERYVLPVRADSRARFPGIVHDTSGSGQTVFIEPQVLVDLGNRLVLAEAEVRDEESRLLAELSRQAAAESSSLWRTSAALSRLDGVLAGGRLALDLEATRPQIKEPWRLLSIRHPLLILARDEVIASDFEFPEKAAGLIITGPNAGGKSVMLKAVGLNQLMLRAGLFVCAAGGSRLTPAEPIFAAFGDAQDISKKLSTFSGHVRQLREIVEQAEAGALVLLDEVGTDTDPREGAALAAAVLEALVERGARVLATTHYPELRALALSDGRFINASMGFEPDTFTPTYRLELGIAGQSFALAVARRHGLDEGILGRARQLLGEREWRLAELSRELAEQRERLLLEQDRLREAKAVLIKSETAVNERARQLSEREKELLAKKRAELISELGDARRRVAEVIAELQGGVTMRRAVEQSHELKNLEVLAVQTQEQEEQKAAASAIGELRPVPPAELKLGLAVYLPSFRATGVVESIDEARHRVFVNVRGLRVQTRPYELCHAGAAPAKSGGAPKKLRPEDVRPGLPAASPALLEIDLRGERVDDALRRLEEFLDQAFRREAREVRIIHGHGTGALKKAVREYLVHCPYIAGQKPCDREHGGDGATSAVMAQPS